MSTTQPCLVRGGRVVDPSQVLDAAMDVLLIDGAVARVAEQIPAEDGWRIVDATGLVVAPGLIDAHVHLREPGFEHQETLRTGLQAAAAGGFTAVAAMADSDPVHDQRTVTDHLTREAAEHPWARMHPVGALTRGRRGEELAEMGDMAAAGTVAFSDAGRAVARGSVLRRALLHVQHYDLPVIQQAEDGDLAGEGVMHEGPTSTLLGLPGVPSLAEESMVARDLLLAADTGGRLHFTKLSTAGALARIREAKAEGVAVTCAVTPFHLLLTDQEVSTSGFKTAFKMRPPLRSAADVEALLGGLSDRTVDAIVSGHAPHHPDEKDVQWSAAPFGAVGLETTLSVCLDRLVRPGKIDLARLIDLLSCGPARALGLNGGTLSPGAPADLTLIDLEKKVRVNANDFYSMGRATPFDGVDLVGGSAGTILAGQPIELPT